MLTSYQKTQISDYINMYRTKHQVDNLMIDNTISLYSQNWSDNLLTNNLFKHSGTQLYGENLAYFQGYGTDVIVLLKLSVDAWYNEIKLYDYNNPGFSEETGHFSCLIWKSSTSFGIGISIDTITSKAIICMNTYLPGNITGPTNLDTTNTFKINVLPLLEPTPIPKPTPIPMPTPMPTPIPMPMPMPMPKPKPTPMPVPVPMPTPNPKPKPTPMPVPVPMPVPNPMPLPVPYPEFILPMFVPMSWVWYFNYYY